MEFEITSRCAAALQGGNILLGGDMCLALEANREGGLWHDNFPVSIPSRVIKLIPR